MLGTDAQGELLGDMIPRLVVPAGLNRSQVQKFWLEGVKPAWRDGVGAFFASDLGLQLHAKLAKDSNALRKLFPHQPLRLLSLLEPQSVRVVILGQDPYHGAHQAEGLAFSVAPGVRAPPSLKNIFEELNRDVGVPVPRADQSSLMPWVKRGVFLLNTCLTVREGEPASHAHWGWEGLTEQLLESVLKASNACVFMLWGAHAQRHAPRILAWAQEYRTPILVLESNHPSPLSARRAPAPFIGCGHFSTAQAWLKGQGLQWDWAL